jgi:hypothetical protein
VPPQTPTPTESPLRSEPPTPSAVLWDARPEAGKAALADGVLSGIRDVEDLVLAISDPKHGRPELSGFVDWVYDNVEVVQRLLGSRDHDADEVVATWMHEQWPGRFEEFLDETAKRMVDDIKVNPHFKPQYEELIKENMDWDKRARKEGSYEGTVDSNTLSLNYLYGQSNGLTPAQGAQIMAPIVEEIWGSLLQVPLGDDPSRQKTAEERKMSIAAKLWAPTTTDLPEFMNPILAELGAAGEARRLARIALEVERELAKPLDERQLPPPIDRPNSSTPATGS